jgi:Flp pilus assembly pilin Flp
MFFGKRNFRLQIKRLGGDSGAQFLEYALLAALIAIGTSVALYHLKDELIDFFKAIIGTLHHETSP